MARVSEQLRAAIEASTMSRYRISQLTGVDQAVLSKFMAGTIRLSQQSIDAISEVLELELVAKRKRRSTKAPTGERKPKSR